MIWRHSRLAPCHVEPLHTWPPSLHSRSGTTRISHKPTHANAFPPLSSCLCVYNCRLTSSPPATRQHIHPCRYSETNTAGRYPSFAAVHFPFSPPSSLPLLHALPRRPVPRSPPVMGTSLLSFRASPPIPLVRTTSL